MRHLLIGLGVAVLSMGAAQARPYDRRPAERNHEPRSRHVREATRPYSSLERAAVQRGMERMRAKMRYAGTPSFEDSGSSRSTGRNGSGASVRAPNPYRYVEKGAVGAAMQRASAKAHHAAMPHGFDNDSSNRAPSGPAMGGGAGVRAPNPYRYVEKSAVARGMERASAKAHHAGMPHGFDNEHSKRASSGEIRGGSSFAAPNPYRYLEKAAVMRGIDRASAKAHHAGMPKGQDGSAHPSLNRMPSAPSVSSGSPAPRGSYAHAAAGMREADL